MGGRVLGGLGWMLGYGVSGYCEVCENLEMRPALYRLVALLLRERLLGRAKFYLFLLF